MMKETQMSYLPNKPNKMSVISSPNITYYSNITQELNVPNMPNKRPNFNIAFIPVLLTNIAFNLAYMLAIDII